MLEKIPLPQPHLRPWALFLDVDGTLLELVDHPDKVRVPEELPGLLGQLRNLLGGATALVSGRSLQTLDTLFGLRAFDAAGCHGAEFRLNGKEAPPAADQTLVARIARRLIEETFGLKNIFVEIKPQSVALHFRISSVDPAEALLAMERGLAVAPGEFRILRGKNVFEAVGCHTGKDIAVARFLLEEPYFNRTPVFIGDDVSDEAAFAEVNRRGGLSIRVGERADSVAQYCIADVKTTSMWLRDWLLPRLCQMPPIAPQRHYLQMV
ncbi:MAG: trehalose-phosphatase [Rhodospirillaceae bacterium]